MGCDLLLHCEVHKLRPLIRNLNDRAAEFNNIQGSADRGCIGMSSGAH